MDTVNTPTLENFINNPIFNFSHTIQTNEYLHYEQDDDTADNSPYSNLDIKCNYLDETSFCNNYTNHANFTFFSLNIQSLHAKYSEFQELINSLEVKKCSPDIILLQEIWQIQNAPSLHLDSYSPLEYKCRSNFTQGGGVGIYFKNNLRYNILTDKTIFIDRVIETIFAEVWTSNNKKIIIASLYRPSVNHPSMSSSEQFCQFIDLFSNILNSFTDLNVPVYIFGDFNLDALKYNIANQVTEYIDNLFSHGFIQIMMRPTRCTPITASLIDHIVTNSRSSVFETVILVSRISDHFPILFISKDCKTKHKPNIITYQNFSSDAIDSFKNNLKNINWNSLTNFQNTQQQYDDFTDTFFSLYDISFPLLKKTVNRNNHSFNPWLTKGLLTSRQTKIKLCKLSVSYPFEPHISNFKKFRNLYAKVLRASKKLHYQHILNKYQSNANTKKGG